MSIGKWRLFPLVPSSSQFKVSHVHEVACLWWSAIQKKKESLERKDESGNKIILTFSPLSLSAISALSEPESLYFLFPRRSHRIFHRCPLTPIQDVSFRFPIQQHDDEYYPRAYRLLAILNGLRSRRCAVGHLLSDHWASTYSIVSELGLWVAFSLSSGASKEHWVLWR